MLQNKAVSVLNFSPSQFRIKAYLFFVFFGHLKTWLYNSKLRLGEKLIILFSFSCLFVCFSKSQTNYKVKCIFTYIYFFCHSWIPVYYHNSCLGTLSYISSRSTKTPRTCSSNLLSTAPTTLSKQTLLSRSAAAHWSSPQLLPAAGGSNDVTVATVCRKWKAVEEERSHLP